MRGAFAALSILLLLTEKSAQISTVIHYFLSNQHLWGWWTLALLLPACLIQALSFHWFRIDGHRECCCLTAVHLLQLGIMKRYWDSLWAAVKGVDREASNSGELLMKLGDLSILRLLESLLQTLPHLLLQAYIYLAVEETDLYPGVSAGLSLLSLSWALVSYSRFMCLLKPGHLYMPWAALLCQLLWRMGMLGTRVMALTVFTKVHHFWSLAAGGAHWLVMSFWLGSQQTDIIIRTCHWKMFNILIGAVYIFCYINLRDGSSRCRVIIFYSVMLIENIILLLLATDFLQEALWSSVWMTLVVMAGFVIGSAALIIYYSLLHPKSTEISQSFKTKLCEPGAWKEPASRSVSQSAWKNESSGECVDTLDVMDMNRPNGADAGASEVNLESHATWIDMHGSHHHWMLIKLALKTGNVSKINAAFGDGGIDEMFNHRGLESTAWSFKRKVPGTPEAGVVVGRGCLAEETGSRFKKREFFETSDYVTVESDHESRNFMSVLPTVIEERASGAEPAEVSSDHVDVSVNQCKVQMESECKIGGTSPLAGAKSGAEGAVGLCTRRAETCNDSSLYFSADMEGVLPSCGNKDADQQVNQAAVRLENDSALRSVPETKEIEEEMFPVSGISPILGGTTKSNFRRSTAPSLSSQCDESTVSMDTSDYLEQEGILGAQYSHLMIIGNLAVALKNKRKQEEEPCFTSTPKPEQTVQKLGSCEPKAKKKLTQLTERDVAE